MELHGILGDIHIPWHDERKVSLALDVFEDQKITHLKINGDCLDFYNINFYGVDKTIKATIEDEFHAGIEFLKYLRSRFPDIPIMLMEGNHEFRLSRFCNKNVPGFHNILSCQNMLQLDKYEIDWHPYNAPLEIGKSGLFVQHSPPSYSENHANTSIKKKIDQSFIWNCTHRPDFALKVGGSGKYYKANCLGWFGDAGIIKKNQSEMPDNRKAYQFTKFHESWGCSFALAAVYGKEHFVQQIIIENYKCAVGNILYEG